MILAQALSLAGFNRNTYNALAREDQISFMAGEGRDRFTFAHAVGLRCVRRLMDQGAQAAVAAAAVTDVFHYIGLKVSDMAGDTKKFAVGDWLIVISYGDAHGWQTANSPADALKELADDADMFDAFSLFGVSLKQAFAEVKIEMLNQFGLEAA